MRKLIILPWFLAVILVAASLPLLAGASSVTAYGNDLSFNTQPLPEALDVAPSNLTMAVIGSGNVTPAVGVHTYPLGTSVSITAIPASGWQFVNWTGDVSTIANVNSGNTTITMSGDYSITANFRQANSPSVSTDNATAGGTVVWLRGNLDQRGTAATVNASFQWRTGSDAWSDTPARPLANNYTGPFSFNLTGLSANKTYEYRAHATGDGEAFGLTKTFTTIASPVAPTVVTDNATDVSSSSATLWWHLLQEGTAPSGKVTIEWGAAPDQLTHEIGPVYQWLRVPGIGFVPGLLDTTVKPVNIYNWNNNDFAPDKIFIKFKDGTDENTKLMVHVNRGGFVINEFPQIGWQVVQVLAGTVLQKVAEYQSEPTIQHAEPIGRVYAGAAIYGAMIPFPAPANVLTPGTTYFFRAKAVGDGISYGDIMSFTTMTQFSSISGGGGGGGGGTTIVRDVMSGNKFVYPATAKSADQKVNISIPKGTVANTESGQLNSISILVQRDLPESVQSWGVDLKAIGTIYNLQPDGAAFDPPIDLTIKYDPEDAKQIPKGVDEKNLVIGTYDMKPGKWVMLDSIVDPENNTVTARTGHFSLYTIMARTAPASFTVSDLTITPQEVAIGKTVSISAVITNRGDLRGDYDVKFSVDGLPVDTKTVTLDGGASQTVNFTVSKAAAGTYEVAIGSLSDSFTVTAAVVTPVTPTPTTSEPAPTSASPATRPPPAIEPASVPTVAPTTPALPPEEGKPQGQTTLWLMTGLALVAVAFIAVAGWKVTTRKKGS